MRRVAIGATALAIGGAMIGVTTAPFPAPAPPPPASSQIAALTAVTGDPTELGVGDAQIYRMSRDELVTTIDDLYHLAYVRSASVRRGPSCSRAAPTPRPGRPSTQ
nr:hypothetical protein [Gordonia sp. NB41Y]